MNPNVKNIDEYVKTFPPDVQGKLQQMRQTIAAAAPAAKEKIAYGIPTFYLNGNLVHFSAAKDHIGLYPGPEAVAQFKNELSGYSTDKGTIRFPLDKPLPLGLVRDIVAFCVTKNTAKNK